MYKLIEIKKEVGGFYINDKYTVCTQSSLEGKIQVKNHLNEVLFLSEQEWVNQFFITKDVLLYSSYNENFTRIHNLHSNENITLDVYFYGVQQNSPYVYDYLYYNLSEYDNNFIYDLQTGKVVGECLNSIKGEILLSTDKYIITQKDSLIYTYIKTDFSLLWQKDLNDYFLKDIETEVEVKEVYLYENSLIVVAKAGVVRLNIETGELIWKTNYYACTMEIVGQFGYVCTGLSLYRINLEDGETYNYGREYAQLPDFEYEGKTYWAAGNRVVYHEGLLWYLAYDSGDSFVIAIDPENAKYQWIHKIDTCEKVDKIQFYQDKMFVSDSGGNLFIYEEMK